MKGWEEKENKEYEKAVEEMTDTSYQITWPLLTMEDKWSEYGETQQSERG